MTDSERPLEHERLTVAVTPTLGFLAVWTALADLAINRVALRSVSGLSHDTLVTLVDLGRFPRNLAALSGLASLSLALFWFLREPRYASVLRRLMIAGFAGIFLPGVALATVLPADRTKQGMLVIGIGAAHALTILLGISALRQPSPRGMRVGLGLVTAAVTFAFASLVLAVVEGSLLSVGLGSQTAQDSWYATYDARAWVRKIGEVAYLVAPIATGATLLTLERRDRALRALLVGACSVVVTAAGFLAWAFTVGRDFPVVLYGAQRLEMLIEVAPLVYVVPLCLAIGIGMMGVASRSASRRQAGAAMLLMTAGGFAPRTPLALLMMVLGMALLGRAALSLAIAPGAPERGVRGNGSDAR